jgi:hypothetical protein
VNSLRRQHPTRVIPRAGVQIDGDAFRKTFNEEKLMRRISIVTLVCLLAGAAPLPAQETVRPLPIKSMDYLRCR